MEEKADEQHAATESQNIPQQLPPSVTACIPADPADDQLMENNEPSSPIKSQQQNDASAQDQTIEM